MTCLPPSWEKGKGSGHTFVLSLPLAEDQLLNTSQFSAVPFRLENECVLHAWSGVSILGRAKLPIAEEGAESRETLCRALTFPLSLAESILSLNFLQGCVPERFQGHGGCSLLLLTD